MELETKTSNLSESSLKLWTASTISIINSIYKSIEEGKTADEIPEKKLDIALNAVSEYYQQIDWARTEGEVPKAISDKIDKEYEERQTELLRALASNSNGEKLIALDNGINQLHIDYPALVHMFNLAMFSAKDEQKVESKLYDLLDTLDRLLSAQGKELPQTGYGRNILKIKKPQSIIKQESIMNKKLIEALDALDKMLDKVATLNESTITQVVTKLKDPRAIEQYASAVKAGKPETLSAIFGVIKSDDGKKTLSNSEILDALKKGGITGSTPAQKQIINYISTMRPEGVTDEKLKTAQDVTASKKTPDAWKTLHTYKGAI